MEKWIPGEDNAGRNVRIIPTRKLKNDLTGQRFGKLVVQRRSADRGRGKKPLVKWDCLCDCGNITTVSTGALKTGHTKSCGCLWKSHGYANKEKLYQVWLNMRRRCYEPTNKRWEHYGGKGIQVCGEWKDDYLAFREWAMSNGYKKSLTLDRVDNDGDYCPENCRWADLKTQQNNTSRNRWVEFEGKKYTVSQLADRLGLTYTALLHRLDRGWPMERIASQKQRRW